MLDQRFVLLSAVLLLGASVAYAIDTLRGRAKPNRVTWLLWAVAPMVALAAQISGGAGYEALLTLAIGLGPLLVLAASFANRSSYWQIGRFDLICGGLSVLALVLWVITGQGLVALGLSIAADLAAALPTVAKAYSNPETESVSGYWPALPASVITLLTLDTWSVNGYAVALYVLAVNIVITTLILAPNLRLPKRRLQ